jgi:chromosome segregation ATPase
VARVRAKMSAAQERIASLAEQKRELTSKIEGYEAEILEHRKSSAAWSP